ncbi:MAG: DUF4153 domain-containing protein [Actinomycetota bacterium]
MTAAPEDVRLETSIGTALVAGLAAWSIPGHIPGLNFVLTGVAAAAVVLVARRGRVWWPAAAMSLLLVGFPVVRAAEWLLVPNFMMAVALGAFAVVDARTWRTLTRIPFEGIAAGLRGPAVLIRPLRSSLGSLAPEAVWPALRGTVAAVFLLVIFGGLFLSADAAFARLTADVILPSWTVELFPARVIIFAGGFVTVAALLVLPQRLAGAGDADPWSRDRRPWQRVEWIVALGALNLLFLAFVVVQLAVLFGGRTHVLTTAGVTYAHYARQGFFQLVAVAALVLGVVAYTMTGADTSDPRDRIWLRALLGTLCVLTLVVLASALRRLELYEDAYGFTRLRLLVHAAILWIGIILALLLIAGAIWKSRWLPSALIIVTGGAFGVFNLINPDATVARENIERFERTGRIDTAYLATLSEDAVPALTALPEEKRACLVPAITGRNPRDGSLFAFNLSRVAAAHLVAREELQEGGTGCMYRL